MTDSYKINDFGCWKIPSGEGAIYLEGIPDEEERDSNRKRTAELRKMWQPSENALCVYRQLKYLEGNKIVIQLWDDLMILLPDEGPLPFSCELIKVFTKNIKECDRDFTQLFVEFKNPIAIEKGNIGDNTIFETMFFPKSGTYTYNCSLFAWVTEDFEPIVQSICTFITDNENQIITNLDFESVSVYQFLQTEYKRESITSNFVFQFLFRSFYRLDNAGLTPEFKTEFFKLLEELRNSKFFDMWSVDNRLANIKDKQGRTPIQFSFITKMFNTIENDFPIYDTELAKMFGFKRPNYLKSREVRLEEYDYQYSKIYSVYKRILGNNLLSSTLKLFESKFSKADISKTKMLDFIFWQAGKLKH